MTTALKCPHMVSGIIFFDLYSRAVSFFPASPSAANSCLGVCQKWECAGLHLAPLLNGSTRQNFKGILHRTKTNLHTCMLGHAHTYTHVHPHASMHGHTQTSRFSTFFSMQFPASEFDIYRHLQLLSWTIPNYSPC